MFIHICGHHNNLRKKLFFCLNLLITTKIHGSESQGQEGKKCTPKQKKNVTTTVSHLHDRIVSQFSKLLRQI